MSQTQLHVPTSAELVEHRRWPLIVPVLFTLSVLLVISMVVVDVVFGVKYFYLWNPVTADVAHTLTFWAWLLSVPMAAMLAGIGASIAARMSTGRLWLMIGVLVAALIAPFILDFFVSLVGSWPAVVFGVGGVLIITMVLLTCWFWAVEHAKPFPVQGRVDNLQLLAYVLFGIAAWFTCDVASSVVVFGGQLQDWEMVQTSIYSIMIDLVLGWGLLLASHILATRATGSGEAQHA